MNQENEYILLDVILRNGSVNRLTRNGVSYENISTLISNLAEEGFIEYNEEKIMLTQKGLEELKKLEVIFQKKKKEEWIKPDEKSRISKLEKNFIFVPQQNNLTF